MNSSNSVIRRERLRYTASFVTVFTFVCGCEKESKRVELTSAVPSAVAVPVTSQTHTEPTIEERLSDADLAKALEIVVPAFADEYAKDDERRKIPPAIKSFVAWASDHLNWAELELIPATKLELVRKDSHLERGKRTCVSGKLNEIYAIQSFSPQKVYAGYFASKSGKFILNYIAVRSSGSLVDGNTATFCGVVTGTSSYPNGRGGRTDAVVAIGMFDLPENRIPVMSK